MNNTFNCSCEEVIDETDIDYIITKYGKKVKPSIQRTQGYSLVNQP